MCESICVCLLEVSVLMIVCVWGAVSVCECEYGDVTGCL